MHYSACGLRVGDWFEVGDDGLRIPDGGSFCWFAIAAALPVLTAHRDDGDEWLRSRPLLTCPDPPEALHMRVEVVGD